MVIWTLLLLPVALEIFLLACLEPWTRKFLARTLQHKWWVLVAGLKTGAPLWRLLVHDLTKFLPSEAAAYGRQYYGPKDRAWDYQRAWHLHWHRNPHHWEFWADLHSDLALPMPAALVEEMVADWLAASRTITGRWPEVGNWPWWEKNAGTIQLHPVTRRLVENILARALPPSQAVLREQTEWRW